MTILEIIKNNFLVSSVPGGLQVSFSWATVSFVLIGGIVYNFCKKKFKKNK